MTSVVNLVEVTARPWCVRCDTSIAKGGLSKLLIRFQRSGAVRERGRIPRFTPPAAGTACAASAGCGTSASCRSVPFPVPFHCGAGTDTKL